MNAALALVVFLQAGAAPSGASGARPAECGVDGAKVESPWERAKEPHLRRYCDLIARGTSRLVGDAPQAADVVGIADEADQLLPGRAAPSILRGRAYLRLDKPEPALAALLEAKKRDDRALDDPVALLAWARANALTGRLAEAAKAYRAALPRTSTLPARERTRASFEAGLIVMAEGSAHIDDAIAMFRQARRDAQDAMQLASVVALALALDRAGQRDEARAVLAERVRSDVKPVLGDPQVTECLDSSGMRHESDALFAIALEAVDPAAARERWKRYASGPGGKGAWGEHARGREGGALPKPRARAR